MCSIIRRSAGASYQLQCRQSLGTADISGLKQVSIPIQFCEMVTATAQDGLMLGS
jgi:hypothetical protein